MVSALMLTACTNGTDESTSPSDSPIASATPTVDASESHTPIDPSLAAGIPTAEPSAADPEAGEVNASAQITLATVDAQTGDLLVGGFVNGVIEDGGDCQYILTAGDGESVTIHTTGVENNGSTSCGSTTVAKSRIPSGSFTVVLRYVSDKGEAESEAVKVAAP